ncbi:MAG: BatA domain-containing protein [Candidatus Marinimicrobia bacterium]|nr:BatA domain-containing protein [Candidatus Neomarinimicrobiota bacterium]
MSPFFMWLIPLVSIPLIIHILSRRKIKIIEFSSIQFLKKMEHESIRKLQIIQILLLIIRTLMILCIVLMISRPVYKGIFSNWVNDPSSTYSAIIIDDTFSNNGVYDFITREEITKKVLDSVLSNIEDDSQISISSLSKGEIYNGFKSTIPKISKFVSTGYSDGSFSKVFSDITKNLQKEYANKELFIISDAQQSNYQTIQNALSFEEWNVYYYKFQDIQANLSIVEVEVVNDIPLINSPIDIEVTVTNNGFDDVENALLQLIVEDINVGQQIISLKEGKTGKFKFTTAFSYPGLFRGIAEISKDSRVEDNKYYFHVRLPEKLNISIIGEQIENLLFVKTPLNTLNQDSTLLNIQLFSRANLGSVDLRNQDVVIINGLKNIPKQLSNKIKSFLNRDGHLILFPDKDETTLMNLEFFGIKNNPNSKIEYYNNEFQLLDQSSININSIKSLFNQSELFPVKIFKYLPLQDKNNHQLQLKNRDGIWNRYFTENGTVDLFGIALDLEWTNFPLRGAYIPFWHTLIYSTLSNVTKNRIYVGESWTTQIPYYISRNSNIYYVSASNDRYILSVDSNYDISTRRIESVGFHQIKSDDTVIFETAVNIHKSEVKSFVMSNDEISNYFNNNVIITSNQDEFSKLIKSGRLGVELWRWFLIALCILVVFEMVLSNLKQYKNG